MSSKERRLLRRLKERDEDAFRELLRLYKEQVFTLVFRMLGNREEAEDLAQEVFVTVFKSIDGFRGDSKLSTWLYRIAVNHCKNRYKYLARRRQHATESLSPEQARSDSHGPALHGQVAGPHQALEGKRLEIALQQAIAALDDEHRVLILLRDVEGLSYQEISQIAGLAEGTVKSRLHRARLALKDKLKGHV